MPAEILRDREGGDADTAVESPGRDTTQPPSPSGGGFSQLAAQAPPDLGEQIRQRRESMAKAEAEREAAAAAEIAAREKQAATMRPQIEAAKAVVAQTPPAPPAPLAIPPAPSGKLTDFLAPTPGESPENTISKLLLGIGTLAAGFTGLRRGDARPALVSLKGAMEGWQIGDKERADHAFKAWNAESERLIAEHQSRHQTWKDILENRDLTMQQQMKLLELSGIAAGYEPAIAAARTQNLDAVLKFQQHDLDQLNKLQEHRIGLEQAWALKNVQFKIAEMQHEDWRLRSLRDYEQRERLAQQRIKEGHEDKALPGEWFSRQSGERAYPTQADYRSPDFAQRFHKTNQQGVTRVEQISIALPMIDKLRLLTDKILADQPVQNLVRALELEGQGKTASNPDLREWQALVKDTNVKMTSVMGPGQFRVTLLHVLQGAGLKTTDTRATARRLLDQWETNIENDLFAITGQPLRAHMSGPWRGWAVSPAGERKVIEIGPNERIDPGWKVLEEIKK